MTFYNLGDKTFETDFSDEHDFISYAKHITEHIAGEVNVGRGEQGEQ